MIATDEAVSSLKFGNFVFISSCHAGWGGSEELWAGAAKYLKQAGHHIRVYKGNVVTTHPRIGELHSTRIPIIDTLVLDPKRRSLTFRIFRRLRRLRILNWLFRLSDRCHRLLSPWLPLQWRFVPNHLLNPRLTLELEQLRPDLVVISQGDNFDGLEFAAICRYLSLPYAVIAQKACDRRWPLDKIRSDMQMTYQEAVRCYFVSQHNLRLTEMQIGQKLRHAEVVRNPYNVSATETPPWNDPEKSCFKLACVGRLWLMDKGQDILLQVLAMQKWKVRNLHVSFFGGGRNREGLIELAQLLEVSNVSFPGFVENIVDVWQEFHALILPSRAEGLPLALVEAMMCGRLGIMTNVGGVAEIVTDNVTGFIAAEPSIDALDETLERAWQCRHEWEQIGKKAALSIRATIPPDPERIFADKLLNLCQQSARTTTP